MENIAQCCIVIGEYYPSLLTIGIDRPFHIYPRGGLHLEMVCHRNVPSRLEAFSPLRALYESEPAKSSDR